MKTKQAEIVLLLLFILNCGKDTLDLSSCVCSWMLKLKIFKGRKRERDTKGKFAHGGSMYVYVWLISISFKKVC